MHFHVPVDAERLGPLATTRPQLRAALAAVAALDLRAAPGGGDVYVGGVAGAASADLVDGLTREMRATGGLLSTIAADHA